MHLSSRVCKKVRLLVVAALVISALAAGPALARGRKNSGGSGSGVCSVTPNPARIHYDYYTVSGSGLTPGTLLNIYVMDGVSTIILMGGVADNGTFFGTGFAAFTMAGTKNVYVTNALDSRHITLASCSFDAVY